MYITIADVLMSLAKLCFDMTMELLGIHCKQFAMTAIIRF